MHFTTQFPPPNLGSNFSGLVKAENLVTVGSDWAFGMTPPLFLSVAHLVEEIGADRVIKMLTITGVISVARDVQYGTITVGKTASFIAVDRDAMEGDFKNAVVTKTWFEGEVVFDVTGDQV
ncbi:unnamed protein product [Alternaria burnsii]|nr:unnamed protein product [Alternaria burnsii]